MDRVPVQYRKGYARFLDMDIAVDKRVFIPRPETELLVLTASTLLRQNYIVRPFLLDMCGGSGAVSIGMKKFIRNSRIICADVSRDALSVAKKNVEKFGYGQDIELVESDMFDSLEGLYEGAFDAVVSNPPYVSEADYEKTDEAVKAEPKIALFAGSEGIDHLAVLGRKSAAFLKDGGFIAAEVGYDQAAKVKKLFAAAGYKNIKGYFDFNGFERVIVGWKN